MDLTTRNATLQDLAVMLTEQQARKLDVVAPATALKLDGGVLIVDGTDAAVDEDGVTPTAGAYVPTAIFDEGLADKLGVPLAYLRRLRAERPDLLDENVNGWLHGGWSVPTGTGIGAAIGPARVDYPADPRSFLVRLFRGDDGPGVARALLSRNFAVIDHLDVLTAALAGIRDADADAQVIACDLTDRTMRVKVASPSVAVMAPELLAGYRSPWAPGEAPWDTEAGRAHGFLAPDEQPVVFAGFELSNSETGGGAFSVKPRLLVKVCRNGLVVDADALRRVHLGGRLEEGVVRWSAETQERNLALVTSMARDAVAGFLDVAYVRAKLDELTWLAGRQLAKPAETVALVTKRLKFTEQQREGVLDHFIRGGQSTAGGLMQAVTSFAQTVPDADTAAELEAAAVPALRLAASVEVPA